MISQALLSMFFLQPTHSLAFLLSNLCLPDSKYTTLEVRLNTCQSSQWNSSKKNPAMRRGNIYGSKDVGQTYPGAV